MPVDVDEDLGVGVDVLVRPARSRGDADQCMFDAADEADLVGLKA